jgi:hypothetical protein
MGAVMRRYWIPVLLREGIPDPDGDPMRVRLLTEEKRDVLKALRTRDYDWLFDFRAELPGAHHDFDMFESIRSAAVSEAVEQFTARLS